MPLIKIRIEDQEIRERIEVVAHGLLKSQFIMINDHDEKLVELPCNLREIQVMVGTTCFSLELAESMHVVFQRCTGCNKVSTKRKCMCFQGREYLKMNVSYFPGGELPYCTKETLDTLLKAVHLVYIAAIENEPAIESTNQPQKTVDSALLKETINKAAKYLGQRGVSYDWILKKEFRRRVGYKITKETFTKLAEGIKKGLKCLKSTVVGVIKSGFKCFKKQKPKKDFKPSPTKPELENGKVSEYMLYIYEYLDLILDYSNEEVLDMVRVIIGLSNHHLGNINGLNKEKNSFESEVQSKAYKIGTLDMSYSCLINRHDQQIVQETGNDLNGKRNRHESIACLSSFNSKIRVVNFICSVYQKIRTNHPKKTFSLLKSTQTALCKTDNFDKARKSFHKDHEIEIEGECLFSNERLTGFLPMRTEIFKSKNQPLQLTFVNKQGKLKSYLYKEGSDLSIDVFFNSLTEYVHELVGCPFEAYKILPLSKNSGIIEIKQSRSISSFESVEELKRNLIIREDDFIKLTTLGEHKGFSRSRIDNFLKSLAISTLLCYLFEIRDRTPDNVLIDFEGRMFNIDFEYTLGKAPSYLRPDIEIPSLISKLIKSDTLIFNKFKYLLETYFKLIRKNYLKILMMSKVLTNRKTTCIDQTVFKNMLMSKLFLHLEESIAEEKMLKVCKRSLGNYKTKIRELLACAKKEITC